LESAGPPRIRFHDLRHSTASLLGSLSVPAKIIQEVMGHSQISVTMDIYARTMPGMQADAMRELNALLLAPGISAARVWLPDWLSEPQRE
jgi:integrase